MFMPRAIGRPRQAGSPIARGTKPACMVHPVAPARPHCRRYLQTTLNFCRTLCGQFQLFTSAQTNPTLTLWGARGRQGHRGSRAAPPRVLVGVFPKKPGRPKSQSRPIRLVSCRKLFAGRSSYRQGMSVSPPPRRGYRYTANLRLIEAEQAVQQAHTIYRLVFIYTNYRRIHHCGQKIAAQRKVAKQNVPNHLSSSTRYTGTIAPVFHNWTIVYVKLSINNHIVGLVPQKPYYANVSHVPRSLQS